MSEIHGLQTQILANLEYSKPPTSSSRLDIAVEIVDNSSCCYNAFIYDKVTRERLIDASESHKTVIESLESLLDLSCCTVPEGWGGRLLRPVPGSSPGSELESNAVSPTPVRGQKRNASAMESLEDDEHFAGFTRLPPRRRLPPDLVDVYREEYAGSGPLLPPVGGSVVAARVCDLLPSAASDGARKMLFEIITGPRYSSPEGAVAITHLTYKTGLEYSELRGYAEELERLGQAERTSLYSWRPVHFFSRPIPTVAASSSRTALTRSGPAGVQRSPFTGFATWPSASNRQRAEVTLPVRKPVGSPKLAHAVCETLSPNISVGARKLLYELITRPQLSGDGGVPLSSIASDHDLDMTLLLKYAEELRVVEHAEAARLDETVWSPTNLFTAL